MFRIPLISSDSGESAGLAEARALLGRFGAEMGQEEGLARLSEALSLLADIRAESSSEPEKQTALNLSLECMKNIQAHAESSISGDPAARLEDIEAWLKALWEFEAFGFTPPQDVAETRSKLLAEKVNREVALMTPSERRELIKRLQAIDIDGVPE